MDENCQKQVGEVLKQELWREGKQRISDLS